MAVVGLFTASAAHAATSPALVGVASNSGSLSGADAIAVSGNFAYTTAYFPGELTAVDISNPAAPVVDGSASAPAFGVLGESASTGASGVFVVGGYAYVASKNRNGPCMPGPAPNCSAGSNDDGSGNALSVFDIATNPASPAYVGSVSDTSAGATSLFGAYDVAVSGNFAYVAAQGCLSGQPCPTPGVGNAFDVIDISNPAAPTIVATLSNNSLPAPWTGTNALEHADSVAVSGNYAFVAAFLSNRLTVIDISNPSSPTIVNSLVDATNLKLPSSVAVSGGYAYVADQTSPGRLTVVDVRAPTAPSVAGSIAGTVLNGAYRVRVRGNFAYVAASGSASVAAIDVSNPLKPRIAGSITDTANLNNATGLALDSTGAYALAASVEQASQQQPLYPPIPPTPGAPANIGTFSVIRLDPAPIGVSIASGSEPSDPTGSTSAGFSFSTTDSVATVLCSLDASPYGPCTSATSQTYGSLATGTHTFSVQATDAVGNIATASYTWTIEVAPTSLAPPTISGPAVQGQTLTESNGSWSNTPTGYTYQWEDCDSSGNTCSAIAGATQQTYTPVATDVGQTIVVLETATNAAGPSAPESSAPTAVVVPLAPASTAPPTISGSAVEGKLLTETSGSWANSPTGYTYQWEDCDSSGNGCAAISGATRQMYTLTAGDVGRTIVVRETATNAGGASATASSAPTAVVLPVAPVSTSPPKISGSAVQGHKLSASPGTWSSPAAVTYHYQWQLCVPACSNIAGATGTSLTLTTADVGAKVGVSVSAINSGGTRVARSSEVGPVQGGVPSPAAVKAALTKALTPKGKGATLKALRKADSFAFAFVAPGAGTLAIAWQATVKGKVVLVATATKVFRRADTATVKVKLTTAGRTLLRQPRSPKLTATATFTLHGGVKQAATRAFVLKP